MNLLAEALVRLSAGVGISVEQLAEGDAASTSLGAPFGRGAALPQHAQGKAAFEGMKTSMPSRNS